MRRAVDELRASGAPDRVLKPGTRAPHFALPDADEKIVDSVDLLTRGPLVVTFYRGRW
jgi:peroxiredoxin